MIKFLIKYFVILKFISNFATAYRFPKPDMGFVGGMQT